MLDYYEILEVHPKASQEIIKKAYLTLAKKYHPDTTSYESAYSEQKIKQINEAYAVLSNPDKRSAYDRYYFSKKDNGQSKSSSDSKTNAHNTVSAISRITNYCQKYLESLNQKVVKKTGYESQNYQSCDYLCKNFYKDISTDYQFLINTHELHGDVADILVITLWNFATCYTWGADFVEAERLMNMASSIIEPSSEFYQKFCKAKSDIHENAVKQKSFNNSQSMQNRYTTRTTQFNSQSEQNGNTIRTTRSNSPDSDSNPFLKIIALIVFCVVLYYGCFASSSKTSRTSNNGKSYSTSSINKSSSNIWTGYEANAPILSNNGMCRLTIDNSQNSEPVYVRLWTVSPSKPVRAFYIASNGSFTLENLTPDTYELRYKYLYENKEATSGAKSQSFSLTQYETETGTRYSVTRITLYKVTNGNFRTSRIGANEI